MHADRASHRRPASSCTHGCAQETPRATQVRAAAVLLLGAQFGTVAHQAAYQRILLRAVAELAHCGICFSRPVTTLRVNEWSTGSHTIRRFSCDSRLPGMPSSRQPSQRKHPLPRQGRNRGALRHGSSRQLRVRVMAKRMRERSAAGWWRAIPVGGACAEGETGAGDQAARRPATGRAQESEHDPGLYRL